VESSLIALAWQSAVPATAAWIGKVICSVRSRQAVELQWIFSEPLCAPNPVFRLKQRHALGQRQKGSFCSDNELAGHAQIATEFPLPGDRKDGFGHFSVGIVAASILRVACESHSK
jgi:hypothetical protein